MALTQDEIATIVDDLDTRVDKLRLAYEQYFMGFEKIEPMRAREDLQRRMTVLLRENIRNTALRFKFNQVQARLGTYLGYWQRICKQIENGTYERHLRKAIAKPSLKAPERKDPSSWDIAPQVDADDLDDLDDMFDAIRRRDSVLPAPPAQAAGADDEWEEKTDPGMSAPSMSPPARFGGPPDAVPPARFGGPPDAVPPARPSSPQEPGRLPLPGIPANFGIKIVDVSASEPDARPTMPIPGKRPAEPQKAGPIAATLDVSVPAPPLGAQWTVPVAPEARNHNTVPVRPAINDEARPTAPVARHQAAPVHVPPPAPIPARPAAIPPRAPARSAGANAPGTAEQYGHAPPVAAPRPAAIPPREPAITAPPQASGVSDARVRELYEKLVASKQARREPLGSLSLEGVAKSVRESQAKLAVQHKGRSVDFEVSEKDGKTVLRPIVK